MSLMSANVPPRNPPARLIRRADLTVHELDGEALVYDGESGNTHRLNSTARWIWEHCDGRYNTRQIADRLVVWYEVPIESAVQHVERMLSEFAKHRLVTATNGDSHG